MRHRADYRAGHHCVFGLHAHSVFVTKYRRDMLTSEHPDFLTPILAKVCADFGTDLPEINGNDDHLHLLVEHSPQVQAPKLVNNLNGVSSRRPRQQLQMRTHRNHLWSPSQHAVSCGGAPLSAIRQYVQNQHHHPDSPPRGPEKQRSATPAPKDRDSAD